jgi:hypothetical protein
MRTLLSDPARVFLLTLCLLPAAFCRVAAARSDAGDTPRTARRIRFARGAFSTTVQGRLDKRRPSRFFLARARAGQRMSILVTPLTRHEGVIPLVIVTSPSGTQSTEKSRRFDTASTESGDYLIRVGTNLMASNGTAGRFLLKLWIR